MEDRTDSHMFNYILMILNITLWAISDAEESTIIWV